MRRANPVPGDRIVDANVHGAWSERVVDYVYTGVNAEDRERPAEDRNPQATDSAVEESISNGENLNIFDHVVTSSRIRISFEGRISGKVNNRFSPEMGLPFADAEPSAVPWRFAFNADGCSVDQGLSVWVSI
jgi:hypothetical protein